jgi:hypothetical protein
MSEFVINSIDADSGDFGNQQDDSPDSAEPWGCGNMHFTPKLPTNEVLSKYKITVSEYTEIAGILEEKLSFGSCGWCV